jgi:hypothetical protein
MLSASASYSTTKSAIGIGSGPTTAPYGEHYKRRNAFRFPGTGHTQFSFPSIVFGLNEAAAIMSDFRADLAEQSFLNQKFLDVSERILQ